LLSADSVSFSYRDRSGVVPVLHDVTLAVPEGGLVGILGPNGSGKTTLLKLLAGLLTPGQGRVSLRGEDLTRMPRAAVACELAVVPQETHPAFEYSALEMVLMGRYPHLGRFAIEGPDDLRIVRDAMAATGTSALEHRAFDTLSGGEKQRVVIAGALAQASDVLLLDEPTTALDLRYQFEVLAVLKDLNASRGTTVVISTHDLNLVAALCQQVVLLKDGSVLAQGPTAATLNADNIRALYDVDADVRFHERAGHLTVVPLARH